MEAVNPSLSEQSKKMRDLLATFHSQDLSPSASYISKSSSLDAIDSASFDADQYMNTLVQRSSLEGLLQKHIQMAAEIKNLDTDLQMLVYENYNKFISATDTIKRMESNIVGMEGNMQQLLQKILTVQSRSDGVNSSLYEKRENIEKLHLTRNLLRKVQFIYDLPSRLGKCIKSEAYEEAVKYYTGALIIFKIYGDSSFQDCKRLSEEAMAIIVKNLQEKLSSELEPIQARAGAAVLLKKLNYPVEYLKARLFEKMEQSVEGLQLNLREPHLFFSKDSSENSREVNEKQISINEFSETIRAYRVIFPESEVQLLKLTQDLINRHFDITNHHIKVISAENLIRVFAIIWNDMLLLEEVMPEALLPELSLQAAKVSVKDFIDFSFSNLLDAIFDDVLRFSSENKNDTKSSLRSSLEAAKNAVLKGSVDLLLKLTQFLTEKTGLVFKTRNLITDWILEGFQNFFTSLNHRFFTLSKPRTQTTVTNQDSQTDGLTLILSQLSVFVEQIAVPRITEETATYLSGGSSGFSDNGPAFVPGELCRCFRSSSDKLLSQYINLRTRRVSVLLKKRFSTPFWIKHKEPRDVHMFVDLLLQELEATNDEVSQILPGGPTRKHQRSESNGSSASGRSNTDRATRPNTQKGRSQLLETHLAKLFKQKVEIFTKVKHTQESVLSTIVKLCLKSLQELVRLQSFNRSGFQQIQLDVQFLRAPLKDCVEDEAAVDFLLDEVIVGASERCFDPVPLEPPILEKLIQAKIHKGNSAPPS